MTKSELQAVIDNPLSDDKQRADAQKLLAAMSTDNGTEQMLAESYKAAHALGRITSAELHSQFESARKTLRHPAFSEEAEKLPAKPEWVKAFTTDPFKKK
jgi:hypothetical protein